MQRLKFAENLLMMSFSSWEQIGDGINVAYITFSAMDALQWMGAVRTRLQTADKNINGLKWERLDDGFVSNKHTAFVFSRH